ncbi:MAG: hypothetical protein K2Y37_24995 [Pirellulales bacterium]|nr:hypothetical protein [Pirellulales bacterium]
MKRKKPQQERAAVGSQVDPTHGAALVWFFVAAAVPLGFLAQRLPLDLWYDEVYTLVHFVHRPWTEIVTDYSAPNNHIAYSLFLRPLWLLGAQPLELRLVSYALAVATLALVFALGLRMAGRNVAVLATALLGLSQMYLSHAIQVRGYGLSMLLVLALANLAAAAWHATIGRWRPVGIVLCSATSLYTIPTNLLFIVPVALWGVWLAWRRHGRQRAGIEAGLWGGGLLLGAALYLPVLEQLRAHSAGAPRPSPWGTLQLAGDVLWGAGHDAWPLAPLFLIGLAGSIVAWRRGLAPLRLNLISFVALAGVGSLAIAWALGISPFVRNFCPLLPVLAIGAAWLVDESLVAAVRWARRCPGESSTRRVVVGLLVCAAVFVPQLLTYPARLTAVRDIQGAVQDGYFNYYAANFEPARAASIVAGQVRDEPNFQVAYDDAEYYNLIYYLIAEGIASPPADVTKDAEHAPQGYLYLVLPPKPNVTRLLARIAIPADEWTHWPEVARVGYFRVLRSPERRSLVEFQMQAPAPMPQEPTKSVLPTLSEELERALESP